MSTTCVDRLPRCIGDRYGFDPHLRAQIVIAGRRRSAGPGTLAISRSVKHTCQQTRPNRNHHCPLVVGRASVVIDRPRRLPCRPSECRMNMVVDAHHQRAEGGEVVLIGADRPDGSVDQGKARLNAAISREGAEIREVRRSTGRRLARRLPPSPDGGYRVVYSQRMERLQDGDVLLVRARQRTAIKQLPYFIGSKVVVGTRPRAKRASHVRAPDRPPTRYGHRDQWVQLHARAERLQQPVRHQEGRTRADPADPEAARGWTAPVVRQPRLARLPEARTGETRLPTASRDPRRGADRDPAARGVGGAVPRGPYQGGCSARRRLTANLPPLSTRAGG